MNFDDGNFLGSAQSFLAANANLLRVNHDFMVSSNVFFANNGTPFFNSFLLSNIAFRVLVKKGKHNPYRENLRYHFNKEDVLLKELGLLVGHGLQCISWNPPISNYDT